MTEAPSSPETDPGLTLFEHLDELRRRLIFAALGLVVGMVGALAFSRELFEWLRTPLANIPESQLIVLSPIEMFITYLKLSLLAAIFATSPWILFQIWGFIAPGLYAHEKRWVIPFVLLGTVFFVGGGAFAFYVVMPYGFSYLVSMQPDTVEATYSVAIYFSLVTRLLLAFGVVFELPLVMWILSAAGIVDPKLYGPLRPYWIVIATALAAFLTPPDPFTQMMMAIPLIIFFELGILGGKMLYGRRNRDNKCA